jgi:hypothetical protein
VNYWKTKEKAIVLCDCGELIYGWRIDRRHGWKIRHGENEEHTRIFDDLDIKERINTMAEWYEEIHEREGYGIREESSDNSDL